MPDKPSQSLATKIVGAALALAAAWLAQQAVNQTWKAVSGHKPPKADDEGDFPIAEVVVAAAATGAAAAIARVLASRGTTTYAARAAQRRALTTD